MAKTEDSSQSALSQGLLSDTRTELSGANKNQVTLCFQMTLCLMTITCVTYTICLDAVNHTNQLTHASNGNALKSLDSSSFVVCDRENNVKLRVL